MQCGGRAGAGGSRSGSRLIVRACQLGPTRVRVNRRGSVLLCPRPSATPSSATGPSAGCAHAIGRPADRHAGRAPTSSCGPTRRRPAPPRRARRRRSTALMARCCGAGRPAGAGRDAPTAAAHAAAPAPLIWLVRAYQLVLSPMTPPTLPVLPLLLGLRRHRARAVRAAPGLLARRPPAAALPPVEPRRRRPRSAGGTFASAVRPRTPPRTSH